MYGDNQNLLWGAIALGLFLFLASLTTVSLVKISRLEKRLAPETAAPLEPSASPGAAARGGTDPNSPFYRALDLWEEKRAEERKLAEKTAALEGEDWTFLNKLGLELEKSSTLYTRTLSRGSGKGKRLLFSLELMDENWVLTAPSGNTLAFARADRRVESFLERETALWEEGERERAAWESLLEETARNGETVRLLGLKGCRLEEIRDGEGLTGLVFMTKSEGRPVMTVTLTGEGAALDGVPFEGNRGDFPALLRTRLSEADTREEGEILLDRGVERIRALYGDREFLKALEKRGLTQAAEPREDEDFVYLDLLDGEGSRQASFAVKRHTGEIHIMDGRDVPLADVDALAGEDALPLPDLSSAGEIPSDGFTVLLVGYHNRGTDTMILAHVNRSAGKISLVSIPRDLWWEGHKLNAYFFGSGKEEFLDIVSEICGMRVDYYLSVDMYAFIDVVNALGGIDVTLEREVRDPTYRIVREDGSEGTLYYPPGTYHLDGVEALRLARSRHGSNDFERSLMQQKILGALRERAGDLDVTDLATYGRFLRIASEQTESNMPFPALVKTLAALGRCTLDGGYNLNDESLIYNTYSGYLNLSEAELARAKESEDFNRGQWILLPLHDDWDLIRERIREITGG